MPGTASLIHSAIQPIVAETAFGDYYSGPPRDDGSASAAVVWCAATREFVRRHPTVTAPVDASRPDGCTDLWVVVDDEGLLDHAMVECLDLDQGLVDLPIDQALPVIVERIRALFA